LSTYQPGYVPDDPAQMPGFLRSEFLGIKQSQEQAQPFLFLQVLAAEPTKFSRGMIVYANGGSWNPGAGEGVYVRKSSSWVLLG